MDAEHLEITSAKGPSCEDVRDLLMELVESYSLVSGVVPIREPRGDVGLRMEIGGLDYEVWVDPA
ncbi:hypothetical protein ACIF6K_31650 [Streptomyces sp. NPDC085942]|uniref:hypothetical protein n=1 Tax=Streptomyces sp. NPDC085942 TaxID=3365743 RepID=UPI0037D5C7B2